MTQAIPEPQPSLDSLGRDLLVVKPWQRVWSVVRPVGLVATYFIFATNGLWFPAIGCVACLMFITYVSTSHDLVHRTLGLSRRMNEFLLSGIEMLVLRSGHAFRLTHLTHHRRFPHHDDIEGRAASLSFPRVLLEGIGNQCRLFIWAWKRARRDERAYMAVEGLWAVAAISVAVALAETHPAGIVYIALIMGGNILLPLATVWIPHRADESESLFQTHAVRGRLIPEFFIRHTYHLEHHLYPSVPSWNWPELGRRLDPWLTRRGVVPVGTL